MLISDAAAKALSFCFWPWRGERQVLLKREATMSTKQFGRLALLWLLQVGLFYFPLWGILGHMKSRPGFKCADKGL